MRSSSTNVNLEHLFVESLRSLLKDCPEEVQATLLKHEEDGTLDNPEYQKAKLAFLGKHMCLVQPLPSDLMAAMVALRQNPSVNNTMYVLYLPPSLIISRNFKILIDVYRNGPYMLKRTGSIATWSIEDRINRIKVPTLLINGKYDGAQDSTMEPFFDGIDKVKWVTFAESSHVPHLEEPERFLAVVGGFLSSK